MNVHQIHALTLRQIDLRGALQRLNGDEKVYAECLRAFLEDQTLSELNRYLDAQNWDDAFTAAHALKGLAGNMGFLVLMHATGRLVVLIRGGRIRELNEGLEQVNSCYRDVIDGIHQFFELADQEREENQI